MRRNSQGVWRDGATAMLELAKMTDYLSHSWKAKWSGTRHRGEAVTVRGADTSESYRWCKLRWFAGQVEEGEVPVRRGQEDSAALRHILPSFHPCMICTVH